MSKHNDEIQPIIIKRVKKGGGGHHGGAWKVAYADFVPAMMAFFLLLWLLNVTTNEQKAYISSYFAPADPRIAESLSGAGGVMGGTTVSPEGAMTQTQATAVQTGEPAQGIGKEGDGEGDGQDETEEEAAQNREDARNFNATEEKLRQAMESVPELKELANHLLVDMTPEGLRIQIIDQKGKPMFEVGKTTPLPRAVKLLQLITETIKTLPNKISIRGHTDSVPYGKGAIYTNWELSSDRANASRRVMLAAALDIAQVENVQGKADREPLMKDDPAAAPNRRVSVILLKQSLVAGLKKKDGTSTGKGGKKKPEKPKPRQREEGVIYFP